MRARGRVGIYPLEVEAFGYLEVRRGPLLGRGLELAADYLYEVGAGEECHLQLSSEGVAEVHVQLHVHEGRLVLTTLAETRVNGFPVTGSVYLDPGDLLGVAGVEVHYTQERPEPREEGEPPPHADLPAARAFPD